MILVRGELHIMASLKQLPTATF